MDAKQVGDALREAGVIVHACHAIPGSSMGDLVVMLEGVAAQHRLAVTVLSGLHGVAGVQAAPTTDAILYVRLT